MKKILFVLALIFSFPALAAVSPLDIKANDGSFALKPPTQIDVRVLAANTAESHTVPSGAAYVFFAPVGCDFYARYSGTAAVPAADVTDGTGSEANPTVRYIKGITSISLISATACTITLSFTQNP